nr:MAG TPA: hypothetical protein [Caudoviricetes sp.]
MKMKGFLMAGAERLELPTPGFGVMQTVNSW